MKRKLSVNKELSSKQERIRLQKEYNNTVYVADNTNDLRNLRPHDNNQLNERRKSVNKQTDKTPERLIPHRHFVKMSFA